MAQRKSTVGWWVAGLAAAAAAVAMLAGCGGRDGDDGAARKACVAQDAVDAAAPITRLGVHFMAGEAPLLMGEVRTAANGATFKTTKARFYVSQLALIDEAGKHVPAQLVDEGGTPLEYGLALLDLEHPDSLGLNLRAPAGTYRGMQVSIGVPQTCETGVTLNHSDASALNPPLDVDSDMYWSWDPGYVFLKFEGQVQDGGAWEGFFFHVGEEPRFVTLDLSLQSSFTISADGGGGPELLADFNRLLVAPGGAFAPDLSNEDTRQVHGGALADQLAENLRGSGFLRLAQGHN